MKLSEAIMLGTGTVEFDSCDWNHCLIGVGLGALGVTKGCRIESVSRWPWLRKPFAVPRKIQETKVFGPFGDHDWFYRAKTEALYIISAFATRIDAGVCTLEEAVAWIRENEPQETEVQPEVKSEEPTPAEAVEIFCESLVKQ
jgi:hypothetical protein